MPANSTDSFQAYQCPAPLLPLRVLSEVIRGTRPKPYAISLSRNFATRLENDAEMQYLLRLVQHYEPIQGGCAIPNVFYGIRLMVNDFQDSDMLVIPEPLPEPPKMLEVHVPMMTLSPPTSSVFAIATASSIPAATLPPSETRPWPKAVSPAPTPARRIIVERQEDQQ